MRCLSILLSLSIASCGDFEDIDGAWPLATLDVVVKNGDQLDVDKPLRAAVLWLGAAFMQSSQGEVADEERPLPIAVDLPVNPTFPVGFTVELTEPPAEDTLFAAEDIPITEIGWSIGRRRWGVGGLILYEDENGTGELEADVDRPVALTDDVIISYTEGVVDYEALPNRPDPVSLGFSVVRIAHCMFNPFLGCPANRREREELNLTESITLIAGDLENGCRTRRCRWGMLFKRLQANADGGGG